MPEISPSKYLVMARPCIMCGGQRDRTYAYTTNQGKRSVRTNSRCSNCESKRRAARWAQDRDRESQRNVEWWAANREEVNAKRRAQQPQRREIKALHQRLRKARIRSGQGDNVEIKAVYRQALEENKLAKMCPVFQLPELGPLQVDHVWPLAKGGRHEAENLQILPAGINMRKGVSCPR